VFLLLPPTAAEGRVPFRPDLTPEVHVLEEDEGPGSTEVVMVIPANFLRHVLRETKRIAVPCE